MATDYGQMLQAGTPKPPLEKRSNDANTPGGGQQAVGILLGVILGVAVFFLLAMILIFYCNRRNRTSSQDPEGKASMDRLQKLEAVAPTRILDEWWPTVRESLGLSQGIDNNFVCVFCFDAVERSHEIHELKCLHVFHKQCLEKWYLRSHYTCPMCHQIFFEERGRHIPRPNRNFVIAVEAI